MTDNIIHLAPPQDDRDMTIVCACGCGFFEVVRAGVVTCVACGVDCDDDVQSVERLNVTGEVRDAVTRSTKFNPSGIVSSHELAVWQMVSEISRVNPPVVAAFFADGRVKCSMVEISAGDKKQIKWVKRKIKDLSKLLIPGGGV